MPENPKGSEIYMSFWTQEGRYTIHRWARKSKPLVNKFLQGHPEAIGCKGG